MYPLVQSEKSLGRTAQRLLRRLKNIPPTKKAVVQDILIIRANSALHAKQKIGAEGAVLSYQYINAVCALSARSTV